MKLQPELTPGETIHWAGMPNPSVIFHIEDWAMIPFSLLWGGFTIFWEAEAAGSWSNKPAASHPWEFGMLWGAAFVLIGQYLIWGRFVVDAWLKRHTYYAVTNRRILFLQDGFKRKSRAVYLDALSEIQQEGSATGRIWLGPKGSMFGGRNQPRQSLSAVNINAAVPVLADIDDVDSVYHLIRDLREKRLVTKAAP